MEWQAPKAGDPLAELEALVRAGGRPIGMLLCAEVSGRLSIHLRALPQYSREDEVRAYLEAAASIIEKAAAKRGLPAYQMYPERN